MSSKLDILALIILSLIFGCLVYLVVINGYSDKNDSKGSQCVSECTYWEGAVYYDTNLESMVEYECL